MLNPCKGNHDWRVIYYNGHEMEQDVVRWCNFCGAIVIDIDSDNRTHAGAIMPAKLPQIALGATNESNGTGS